MEGHRVVFHIDEGTISKANMVLHNVKNLLDDLGKDEVDVIVLANGEGVKAFLQRPNVHRAQIRRLADQGVEFLACGNCLRFLGLESDDMLDAVRVVPAGVSELVKRQAEGWAYVRP